MSDGNRDSPRRRGRGRWYRGKNAGEARKPEARPQVPAAVCPLCGEPIYDLSSALAEKETNLPAHFDCVLARVAAAEELESGEKVVYIGAGSFAVVQFRDRNESAFTVKRRISWENEKEKDKREWRKALSQRVQML